MNTKPEALLLADALESADLKSRKQLEAEDQQAAAELRRLHGVEIQYQELLYAVCNKHGGESLHQTALRYIRQAEIHDNAAVTKAKGESK